MARTAAETATILSELFIENFNQDYSEPFRITWPQLRYLSGVTRLRDNYLKEVNASLLENSGDNLIPLNNFLLVTRERDLEHFRMVPDRILEQHLPDDTEKSDDNDDDDI
jgi:hypothetical protein